MKLKGKQGELGWFDNTGLDDTCRIFTKDKVSVECHCEMIPFGNGFVYDYQPECKVHGIDETAEDCMSWQEQYEEAKA